MKTAVVAAAALLIAVGLTIVIARRSAPMSPTGDTAVIENYTMRAEHGSLLVGPYSRFQWHHPGPIYFYALAPFYRASGNRTTGLFAGALAINLIALAILGWTAATLAPPLFATIVVAASTLFVLRVPDLLTSAWNPHVVVLPTMALALAAAGAAAGEVWLLPFGLLLASFAIQTHVGLLPVAITLAVGSLVVCWLFTGADPGRRRALLASVIVLILAWLVPLVEQFRHSPGNFTSLWRFFLIGKTAGQPVRASFAAWADMLSGILRPDFYLAHGWVFKRGRSAWTQTLAIVQLGALAGTFVSMRRRNRFLSSLAGLLFAASLVALWSVTRVEGDLMDHDVFWISGLGVLNMAVVIDAACRLCRFAPPMDARDLGLAYAVLFGIACAIGLYELQQAAARSTEPSPESAAVAAASTDLRDYLEKERISRPLVLVDQDAWGLVAGVLLQLQKSGVDYSVDDDWLPMFTGANRTGHEQVTVSIAGAARHYLLQNEKGTILVTAHDPVFADIVAKPDADGRRY